MMGKTHRAGGMLCALGGFVLLEQHGMLVEGINPMLQLLVMYPFSLFGSTMSDQDQNWHAAPSKDIVGYGLNRVLHLTTNVRKANEEAHRDSGPIVKLFDARHRSWQTHSDLFLLLMCYMSTYLMSLSNGMDANLIRIVSMGLILGIISHLVLDMLTPEGIWSILLVALAKVMSLVSGKKPNYKKCIIHLVPKNHFFSTGGRWETFVRYLLWFLCALIIVYEAFTVLSPYTINFNLNF